MSFNLDEFDIKVAKSIVRIHGKFSEKEYSRWVDNNYEHLEHLSNLANVPFEIFASYVYDHTK